MIGGVNQLVVGNAAPQEERKARGQFQIAEAMNLAEQKFGARQNEAQRAFNARVKAIALPIEAQWSFQIFLRDRTPVGAAREGRDDLFGASNFLGAADEDLAAAGRVA